MCIEYETKKELSATPGLLLNRFAQILMSEWDRERGVVRYNTDDKELTSLDVQLKVLETIANYLFEHNRFSAREVELIQAATPLLSRINFRANVNEVFEQIKEISGLLVLGDEQGTYQFCHSLFQDFFVARFLNEEYYSGNQNSVGKQNIKAWIRKNKNNPRCENILALYYELSRSQLGVA